PELDLPVPVGEFGEEVVAGHVEPQGGDGDVAFDQGGDVGLRTQDLAGRGVGHPVIGAASGVSPAFEALAVAAQTHRDDPNPLGFAARVGRDVDVKQRAGGGLVLEDVFDHAAGLLGGAGEFEV